MGGGSQVPEKCKGWVPNRVGMLTLKGCLGDSEGGWGPTESGENGEPSHSERRGAPSDSGGGGREFFVILEEETVGGDCVCVSWRGKGEGGSCNLRKGGLDTQKRGRSTNN